MTDIYIKNAEIRLDYIENNNTIEEVLLKIIVMNDINKFSTNIKNDYNFQDVVRKLANKAFSLVDVDNLLIAEKTNKTLKTIMMMTKDIDYLTLINMLYNIC
tara:strand:+ start:9 stop:314 length:306 start_codon:yes stop_codon:yes gene_type:complete